MLRMIPTELEDLEPRELPRLLELLEPRELPRLWTEIPEEEPRLRDPFWTSPVDPMATAGSGIRRAQATRRTARDRGRFMGAPGEEGGAEGCKEGAGEGPSSGAT